MTKSDVRKLVKQKIKEGKTKQQTFDEIIELSDMPAEEIANMVKVIPTLASRQKNKTLNVILIVFLSLTVLAKILSGIPIILQNGIKWIPVLFLLPAINVLLLWGVATYRANFHRVVAVFTILGLFNSLIKSIGVPFNYLLLSDFAFYAVLIILGFYCQSKLTPGYDKMKERYISSEGETMIRDKFVFDDIRKNDA